MKRGKDSSSDATKDDEPEEPADPRQPRSKHNKQPAGAAEHETTNEEREG